MRRAVIGVGLGVAVVLTATVAHATVFHAKDEALALAFPGSDKVEERTFILTDEPLDEPPRKLAEARIAAGISPEHFFLMKHGEMRKLTPMFRPAPEAAVTATMAK